MSIILEAIDVMGSVASILLFFGISGILIRNVIKKNIKTLGIIISIVFIVLALIASAKSFYDIINKASGGKGDSVYTNISEEKSKPDKTKNPKPTPLFLPVERENRVILSNTLAAAEETLGWDNDYCSLTLQFCINFFEKLQKSYDADSDDYSFTKSAIKDIKDIKIKLDTKNDAGESLNPYSEEAKEFKEKLRGIRSYINKME